MMQIKLENSSKKEMPFTETKSINFIQIILTKPDFADISIKTFMGNNNPIPIPSINYINEHSTIFENVRRIVNPDGSKFIISNKSKMELEISVEAKLEQFPITITYEVE